MTLAPFPRAGRKRLLAGAGLAGALALGAFAFYGMPGRGGNAGADACATPPAQLAALDALAQGEVAAVRVAKAPAAAPELTFQGPDGAPRTLSGFRGRAVLLNLWATWCVPCRQEMPALDALQGGLGGPAFEVVAVNTDTTRLERPKAWLAEAGVARLVYYSDPAAETFKALRKTGRAIGLPVSLLIDARGCEVAHIEGPAEWASDDAKALMRALIER